MRLVAVALSILSALMVSVGVRPGPAQATFPGSNGRVFFSSFRDGNFEIYRMKPSGAGQTNLTNHPADDYAAAVSPDASKVVFVSERDGDPEIWVMNPDGSDPVQLTDNDVDDFAPEFAPDGRIVFTSDRDGNLEIYIMDADGQNQTRLTDNTFTDIEPTVSPDGTTIAWTSLRTDFEIFTMGIDGSNETQLTDNDAVDGSPDYAPDGSAIVFHSSRDAGDFEIYRMGADGSNQTRLTTSTGLDFNPVHSPNGLRVMWASQRTGDIEIWVADLQTTAAPGPRGLLDLPTQVTNSPEIDAEAAWSLSPRADLRVRKTCADTVAPGDLLRCTITVTNLGPDPSGPVELTDTLHTFFHGDAFFRSIRGEGAECEAFGGTSEGSCSIPSLEPGQRSEIAVRIKVEAVAASPTVADKVQVKGSVKDPDLANNVDEAVTKIKH